MTARIWHLRQIEPPNAEEENIETNVEPRKVSSRDWRSWVARRVCEKLVDKSPKIY